MKLMISGDKHLGLISDGMERLDEQSRLLKRIIEILNDEDPDVYVDLGDLFHVPRPGPACYNLALKYLTEIANWAGSRARSAFMMVGNHDKQTRGHVHALTPFVPVINYISKVDVNRVPSIKLVQNPFKIYHRGYYLIFLPHVTEWEARAALDQDYSTKDYLDIFVDSILDEIGDKPMIVFSHLEVPGAKMSNNETVQRDTGLQIPSELIDAKNLVRVYAGHIHKYQEMKRVTVVGSALHVDFGEALDQKGIIISEVKS